MSPLRGSTLCLASSPKAHALGYLDFAAPRLTPIRGSADPRLTPIRGSRRSVTTLKIRKSRN